MREEVSSYRWVIFSILFVANFLSIGLAQNCLPSLLEEIRKDIPMTQSEWGSIWGNIALAITLSAIFAGMVGDWLGVRLTIGFGIIASGIFCVLRGYADGISSLYWIVLFFGASVPFTFINFSKSLGMWFPAHQLGLASGILIGGYSLGSFVGMWTAEAYLSPWFGGWRNFMINLGIFSIITGFLWLILDRHREPVPHGGHGGGPHKTGHSVSLKGLKEGFVKLLRIKDQWLLMGINMGQLAILFGVAGFLPHSLVKRGMAEGSAHFISSLFFLAKLAGNFVIPTVSDYIGRRKPFFCLLPIGMAVGTSMAGAFTGLPLIAGVLLAGFAMGGIVPIILVAPVEMRSIGTVLAGTSVGIIFSFGNLGGKLSPKIGGRIMDATGSDLAGFLFFAVIILLAVPLGLLLEETGLARRKEYAREKESERVV